MLIGLIADTHGLMRPEALRALQGADIILHAGDVGQSAVLDALAAIAPVRAVYGNVDMQDGMLAASIDCVLDGVRVHVSHGHELGSPTPERLAAKVRCRRHRVRPHASGADAVDRIDAGDQPRRGRTGPFQPQAERRVAHASHCDARIVLL